MGLEELEKEIRGAGEKQIRDIEERAGEKVNSVREEISREAGIKADKILRDGTMEAKLIYRRIVADAVIKNRGAIEKEKNLIINHVFDKAKEKIINMGDREKINFIKKLIEGDIDNVPDPVVLIDKKYSSLMKDAKPADIGDFGVIIQSREGKIRIDDTLDNKIERLKVTLRPQVSAILFKNKKW